MPVAGPLPNVNVEQENGVVAVAIAAVVDESNWDACGRRDVARLIESDNGDRLITAMDANRLGLVSK